MTYLQSIFISQLIELYATRAQLEPGIEKDRQSIERVKIMGEKMLPLLEILRNVYERHYDRLTQTEAIQEKIA